MPRARNELGVVSRLTADAVGEPGHRRFRLRFDAQGGTATVWLEKDQLSSLALALQQVLPTLPPEPPAGSQTDPFSVAPGAMALEFTAESLSLDYEEGHDVFALMARDAPAGGGESATLRVWATRRQMAALAEEALAVCAAGRPHCPLCDASIDAGVAHVCPRGNGHRKEPVA
ncbi:MAG: DUF3090 family protein [Chloroflexi bacterium]|nr:DUF3090 family protein [Chloroflexota bacterium]